MAILPGKEAENARYLYPTIKRWGNTKGVPTQCINGLKMAPPFGKGGGKGGKGGGKGGGRGPKVLGTDGSYSAGILLKARPRCPLPPTLSHASPLAPPPSIQPPPPPARRQVNLKLGGANGVSKAMNQNRSVVSAKPTMVVGLDVNHAGRGSTADSHPAICYSLDRLCSKWATEVTSQKAKEELVPAEWLKARMVHAAQEFQKRNNCPVQRLFFYRDGLAHNMFSAAVVQEVAAIKSAMEHLGDRPRRAAIQARALPAHCPLSRIDICPELVYIVVQKRTRARFCMRTPDGRGYEKPPYGLVVDREVTDATHHTAAGDFYLSPHFALKGRTPRPLRLCPAHLSPTQHLSPPPPQAPLGRRTTTSSSTMPT